MAVVCLDDDILIRDPVSGALESDERTSRVDLESGSVARFWVKRPISVFARVKTHCCWVLFSDICFHFQPLLGIIDPTI